MGFFLDVFVFTLHNPVLAGLLYFGGLFLLGASILFGIAKFVWWVDSFLSKHQSR